MRLLAIVIGLLFGSSAVAEEVETPSYTVLAEAGTMQIRLYDPMIVAEVEVQAGNVSRAANRGFRPLARYIFGSNAARTDIAMTAPVTASPASVKIDMTSPVQAAPSDSGDYVVQFIMPAEWTMQTLPVPKDDSVRLREIPARTIAALRYTGADNEQRRQQAESELRRFIEENGYQPTGPAGWAGYDSPWTPRSKQRFEVTIPVESAR